MGPYSFLCSLTVERVDLLAGGWGYIGSWLQNLDLGTRINSDNVRLSTRSRKQGPPRQCMWTWAKCSLDQEA